MAQGFTEPQTMSIEEVIQVYDLLPGQVDEVLHASGIGGEHPLPEVPDDLEGILQATANGDPLPPQDLTAVSIQQIGQLFGFYQSWTNYVAAELTRTEMIRDIQHAQLQALRAVLEINFRNGGSPAGMIGSLIDADRLYVQAHATYLKTDLARKLMADRSEQLRRTLNTISREQTRRQAEFDTTSPGGNRPVPAASRFRT